MLLLLNGFLKMKDFKAETSTEINRFSIIIPFRNEAENIPQLIVSLQNIEYPRHLFEVIFVDDASEDNSEKILIESLHSALKNEKNFDFQILKNQRFSNSPKKDAITNAIKISNFEWIVTTDADCEVPLNWLNSLDSFIQKNNVKMVCGPVLYKANNEFLQQFQQLDGFSLQAATIGSFGLHKPLLCNGANLAYRKSVFQEISGFEGNNHLPSGDDIFMMEKVLKVYPNSVKFVKSREMIVKTNGQKSWKDILNQRIRWASKTSKTKNYYSKLVGILVTATNLIVLFGWIPCIFETELIIYLLLFSLLKIIMDALVLSCTARFFEKKFDVFSFLKSVIMYPFLVTYIAAASLRGNYIWKGRKFNNNT